MLLHQLAWAFFIGKGVHLLPVRAGLLWSWLLYKLHSHRAARCSVQQFSPWHPWQLGKSMEPSTCWEQQILSVFLLNGTGAPGSCWAPSYSSWSQCPSWRAKRTTWLITLLLWKAKASSCCTQLCSYFNTSQESMCPCRHWWSYIWNPKTSQTYKSSPAKWQIP